MTTNNRKFDARPKIDRPLTNMTQNVRIILYITKDQCHENDTKMTEKWQENESMCHRQCHCGSAIPTRCPPDPPDPKKCSKLISDRGSRWLADDTTAKTAKKPRQTGCNRRRFSRPWPQGGPPQAPGAIADHYLAIFMSFSCHFHVIFMSFYWLILASCIGFFRDGLGFFWHFWVILVSYWCHFPVIFTSFWWLWSLITFKMIWRFLTIFLTFSCHFHVIFLSFSWHFHVIFLTTIKLNLRKILSGFFRILLSFPCHFGVILVSFWCHFGVILVSFSCHFYDNNQLSLRKILSGFFRIPLSFPCHFGVIFMSFVWHLSIEFAQDSFGIL